MSNYLIELAVVHMVLILGYLLLLRKEIQYAKLRGYLLGTTAIAMIIPSLKLPKLLTSVEEPTQLLPADGLPLDDMQIIASAAASPWHHDLLIWAYVAVSAFFLFKFFANLHYMIHLDRTSTLERFRGRYIRRVHSLKGSFTFFNWIFLSADIDKNQEEYDAIIRHEIAHVAYGHTYDLMFLELFKICFWWIPTAWLVRREMRKIHEYQADAYALRSYTLKRYSSILIRSTLKSNGMSLASSFHDSLTLKRIQAMKRETRKISPWKPVSLSMLCAALFILLACTEEPVGEAASQSPGGDAKESFSIVEQMPEFEGGLGAFYQYIASRIRYPKEARSQGIEGKVYVQFVIERDGSLTQIEPIKGIGAGCEEELVRVLKEVPSFSPGAQRGKKVRVRSVLPVIFKLNKEELNPDNTPKGIIIVEEVAMNHGQLKVEANYRNGQWVGTVFDPEGEELPGTNIIIAGTSNGTVADLDGTFKLEAKASDELYFSFVGYEGLSLRRE